MRNETVLLVVFGLLAFDGAARAEVTIPDPGTFVVDRAGIFDAPTRHKLEGWLRDLEEKTTAQVKVLTVATTDGEPFFDFVQRHAELWKLGRAGQDNGVLIVVAVHDQKYQIQVGYGLEGVLPDQWCGSLGRKVFVPNFRQRNYARGLYHGTIAVANKIADGANVTLSGVPDIRHRGRRVSPKGMACGGLVPLVIIILLSSMSRRSRYRGRGRWGGGGMLQGVLLGSILSGALRGGGRSHWGGGFGGGSFGGGFGGGSFGGGGGFGGGGAGGGW